jgi:hypothetical protein
MSESTPTELDLACQAYREAKANEESARNARLASEERILSLVGVKEEGTTTIKTEWFKVATVGNLTRTLLVDELPKVQGLIDQRIYEQVIKYEPKLSVSGLKAVATANPDAYRVLLSAVTTRPAKATVKVEVL